jgi:hypothetical protein
MIENPLNLSVLLHCYYSPEPHPRINSPAVQDALNYLLRTNMISGGDNDNIFHTTPRGEAYIKYLMALPFPEQHWIMPNGQQ